MPSIVFKAFCAAGLLSKNDLLKEIVSGLCEFIVPSGISSYFFPVILMISRENEICWFEMRRKTINKSVLNITNKLFIFDN